MANGRERDFDYRHGGRPRIVLPSGNTARQVQAAEDFRYVKRVNRLADCSRKSLASPNIIEHLFRFSQRISPMTTSCPSTRRRFLQGMAAAGAASKMVPSTNRALGYQSANDRPVFATIGLRNQGWPIIEKSVRFADFAALADVDSKVLEANVEKTEEKQGKKPDAYKDYRRVLDRKEIDAVMIATPDHWHT